MGASTENHEMPLVQVYAALIEEHRAWLKEFGEERVEKWGQLLKADPEAAICEAATRELLCKHSVELEPYENISSGGPDFLCVCNRKRFYVETTCITKDAATRETGLNDPAAKACCFALLTKKIFGEIVNKTPQCSNLDAPCVVAVGTLHFAAGHICFDKMFVVDLLTGTPFITAPIDTRSGGFVREPYEATNLESAAFIKPTKTSSGQVEYARNPISAILLCPFACRPMTVIGVLHPNPVRPFDRTLLTEIEFCRLAEGYETGRLGVEWV